jgi:ABC-type antimicrobial peptide transport system permease subunit
VPPTVSDLTTGGAPTRNLAKALGSTAEEVDPAVIPAAMSNLSSVRGLPLALGVFLVLLAIGALAHALVSSVARRRQELAVLRALGVTSRASRTMIAVHATVVGLVGLVIGVPAGLIVGRGAWEWVASAVPFLYIAPLALVAAAVAVPAALILANLVAAVPARIASRVRPAEILRAE